MRTQAILCGQRVQLIHGQGDSIVACTDDATVAAATSMQRVGRHDYRRTVRLEEVSSLQEQQREA